MWSSRARNRWEGLYTSDLPAPAGSRRREKGVESVAKAGSVNAGSPTTATVGDESRLLSGNVATALGQVERTVETHTTEAERARRNDRSKGFAGVVSHDL